MNNPETVIKYNFDSYTDYQKRFHEQSGDDDRVECRYVQDYEKQDWAAKTECKLVGLPTQDGFRYIVNNKFDCFSDSYLSITLPKIKVADEYKDNIRICWTPKVGFAMIASASLLSDESTIHELDRCSLDIYYKYYSECDKEVLNHMIGNIDILTNWSTILPKFPLEIPQPWTYSSKKSSSFPLFMCKDSVIQHDYKFNLDLTKLVRMQLKKKGDTEWSDISFDNRFIIDFPVIPFPIMIGEYSKLTEDIKNFIKKEYANKPYNHIVKGLVHCKTEHPSSSGEVATVPFHSTVPIKNVHWFVENQNALDLNEYFVYTFKNKNIPDSVCPIESGGPEYGSVTGNPDLSMEHYTLYNSYRYHKNYTYNPGYYCKSLCFDDDTVDTGLVIKEGKVTIKIKKEDEILDNFGVVEKKIIDIDKLLNEGHVSENTGENKTLYNLHVVLETIYTLSFDGGKCFCE